MRKSNLISRRSETSWHLAVRNIFDVVVWRERLQSNRRNEKVAVRIHMREIIRVCYVGIIKGNWSANHLLNLHIALRAEVVLQVKWIFCPHMIQFAWISTISSSLMKRNRLRHLTNRHYHRETKFTAFNINKVIYLYYNTLNVIPYVIQLFTNVYIHYYKL